MNTILHIETSTSVCSVALSQGEKVLMNYENFEGQSHATLLGLYVEKMMTFVRENSLKLDAVSVSSGPGSYTGLRIGVSEAKGLSYGLSIPLIAIPTHELMAFQLKDTVESDALLCPMIDARRMEVYATFFDTSLNVVRKTSADIVDENSYLDLLDERKIYFFGNGAEKCRSMITHANARFVADIHPLASAMVTLANKALANGRFVDSAYFEPFYLKEFVATVPKNKIINN